MATVVLVVGNAAALTAGDTVLQDRLTGLGHSVVLASDEDAEYGGTYDGVMVSDSCAGATFGAKYDTVAKPGLTLESPTWRLGSNTSTATVTQWSVNEVGDADGGLTGTQTIYNTAKTQQGLTSASVATTGGQIVATPQGVATNCVYVIYESGVALTSGTAPARRVFFRVLDGDVTEAGGFSAQGLTLLDAAITWAFGTVTPPSTNHGSFLPLLLGG